MKIMKKQKIAKPPRRLGQGGGGHSWRRLHGAWQCLDRAHMREPTAGPGARPHPAHGRAGGAVTPAAALAARSGKGRR